MFHQSAEKQNFIQISLVRVLLEKMEIFKDGFHIGDPPFNGGALTRLAELHPDAQTLEFDLVGLPLKGIKPFFDQRLLR